MKLEPQILLHSAALRAELGHMCIAFGAALLIVAAIVAVHQIELRLASLRRAGLWLTGLAMAAIVLVIVALAWAADADACPRRFTGMASYYANGDGMSGSHTASGARFVDRELTAAHRCLPFGTRLRVIWGGRSVDVVINDRGPAKWTGRVLDLSRGAAKELGMIRAGIGRVTAEALDGVVLE